MANPTITPRPLLALRQDDSRTDCDGQNILYCGGLSTCYTGAGGFIGCCSTTNCAARTTCVEYNQLPFTSCDVNYGGCVPCTNAKYAHCVTLTNPYESQHAIYCDSIGGTITTAYENYVLTGSMAAPPSTRTSTSSSPKSTHTSSQATTSTATTSDSGLAAIPTSLPVISAHTTSSLSAGSLAGIAIGSVAAGAALIALIAFLILRYRQNPDRQRGNYSAPSAVPSGPDSNYGTPAEKSYGRSQFQSAPLEIDGSPIFVAPRSFGNSPAHSIAESDSLQHAIPMSTLQKDTPVGTPGPNGREDAYVPYRPDSEMSGLMTYASLSTRTSPRASPTLRDGFLRSPTASPAFGSPLHMRDDTARSGAFQTPETIHEAPSNAAVPDFGRNRDRSVPRDDDSSNHRRRTSSWLTPETAMLEGYRDD